ncbi:MAG: hypothetical protein CVU69_05070 [Deltaproteobacteria bacterium HGW-Deltaproteobacteria-4]|nr:MAG: hypothetical protein CVU69_05070 [Deltaproteobacteria bacterium HGW-Deltaproteobacteria-4]
MMNMNEASVQASQIQEDEFFDETVPHEFLNYKKYITNHPETHEILASFPDRKEAENEIYGRIEEETYNPLLACSLTTQIGKRHPSCKPARDKYAVIRWEERSQIKEQRKINRVSGGKVDILDDRLEDAYEDCRQALISGNRNALNSSLVKLQSSIRQYWSDYTKLARKYISADWSPPENKITLTDLQNRPLLDFVLSIDELVNLDLPERESIIAPFLPAQSLSMVFAPRGLGKSWFCMQLALAVADGRKFFAWDVPAARRVLYIDGEMPQKTLVDRFRSLSHGLPSILDVLSSERLWIDDRGLNLNLVEDQARVSELLEQMDSVGRQPELIIIDNLSSMTSGGDENSNSELDNLLQFLVRLRHKGFAILLVHHSGKGGDQRGASRREDLLDTSIKLNAVKNGEVLKGAKFEVEFVKVRGERPNPDKLEAELITGEHGCLEWSIGKKVTLSPQANLLIAIRDILPKNQGDLAIHLAVSQAAVSQQIKRGRENGHITYDKKPTLTDQGMAYCEKISPAGDQF